ncbi:MAG: hypothetical protein A2939_00545 [Parcubacteria group bacterium RIFCSPLOWO2_01_FULL_48_18]|nr:MAG: hypothetical protein A2939_00545 [Parcubacteria group bacterium RIFCSPLOWO2_01_FULL_48_18]
MPVPRAPAFVLLFLCENTSPLCGEDESQQETINPVQGLKALQGRRPERRTKRRVEGLPS